MNKLLAAGLIAAVSVASAQAEVTQCHPGGFYAGLNVGWVHHKVQVKAKAGEISKFTKAILDAVLNSKGVWEKYAEELKAAQTAAETVYKAAETDKNTATTNSNKAASALAEPIVAAISTSLQYTADAKIGDAAQDMTNVKFSGLTGFAKTFFASDEFKAAYKTSMGSDFNVDGEVGDVYKGANKDKLNAAITSALNTIVSSAINGTKYDGLSIATSGDDIGASYMKFALSGANSVGPATATDINNATDELLKAYDSAAGVLKTATQKFESADNALQTATNALSAANKELEKFDIDEDVAAAYKEIAGYSTSTQANEVEKLENDELGLNSNGKRSKTKSGFVAEAVVGFDHRISDIMVGADLFVGFDTSKLPIRDYKTSADRESGNASKARKDSIEIKRQFYVGLMPRIGYKFTPQLEGFVAFGVQMGRYKVDTTGLKVIYDNVSKYAKVYNTVREMVVAQSNNATADTKAKWNEALNLLNDDLSSYDKEVAKYCKKHNKTKFSPVVGCGIRYDFTESVFGTLAYKYQFNSKIADYNKTGIIQVKDQNHTVTVGVGFRF